MTILVLLFFILKYIFTVLNPLLQCWQLSSLTAHLFWHSPCRPPSSSCYLLNLKKKKHPQKTIHLDPRTQKRAYHSRGPQRLNTLSRTPIGASGSSKGGGVRWLKPHQVVAPSQFSRDFKQLSFCALKTLGAKAPRGRGSGGRRCKRRGRHLVCTPA